MIEIVTFGLTIAGLIWAGGRWQAQLEGDIAAVRQEQASYRHDIMDLTRKLDVDNQVLMNLEGRLNMQPTIVLSRSSQDAMYQRAVKQNEASAGMTQVAKPLKAAKK
jgi:hypothetical protein